MKSFLPMPRMSLTVPVMRCHLVGQHNLDAVEIGASRRIPDFVTSTPLTNTLFTNHARAAALLHALCRARRQS